MRSYDFLFWAYNVIWFGLAGYVLFTFLRVRRLDRRLLLLERDMDRADRPGVAPRKS
jgi:CcmD family protein